MKTFAGLTKRQHEVFAEITVGQDLGHPPRVIKVLEDRGMIKKRWEALPGWPPVKVAKYDFDLGWHIKWCQWCGEQENGK